MSLSAAAAAMGLPETLVQRSAEARAAEAGSSPDEILAAWAGGEAVAAAATADPPTQEPAAVSAEPAPEAAPTEVSIETPAAPIAQPTGTTRAPIPSEVTAAEATHLPDVITVPTAGIRERTNFAMPKWLTALLVIAPLFALFALGGSATGTCGEGTELATDVITGDIVNCDGSEFTGSQVGDSGPDFVAEGEAVYAASCAGCHGVNGGGAGTFPAMTGVVLTFGSCADHIEWVDLGSNGFSGAGRLTYGDTGKTVNGQMPGFGSSLSAEQLAAVVAFERVRFGGADEESVGVDCGIVAAEGEGEAPAEGEDAEASAAATG